MFLSPGSTFGKYRICEKIGVGGMAEVWWAIREPEGESVAIKVILDAFADDPKFGERFLREARILKRLQHSHIIPVLDFGKDESGDAYLVTPLLRGGSLAEAIRHDRLGENVLSWLDQLAAAIDFAHKAGVIHRDVKPSNILFDAEGQLYLCDFGLAKAASSGELTTTGATIGTPLYMSPEQVRGEELDSRTDVYSLGMVAYQLLARRRPYAGDSVATILLKTLNVLPDPPSSVNPSLPAAIDGVVLRAVAKDREHRYRTCAAFVAELARAFTAQEVGLEQPFTSEQNSPGLGVVQATEQLPTRAIPREIHPADRSLSAPRFMAVIENGSRLRSLTLALAVVFVGAGFYFLFKGPFLETVSRGVTREQRPQSEPPRGQLARAKKQVEALSMALNASFIEDSRFPEGPWYNAFKELRTESSTTLSPRDPWGYAYRYVTSTDRKVYVLLSAGPDCIYQNSDAIISRLLETRCRSAGDVISGDNSTTDIVVCNGHILSLRDPGPSR